MEIWKVNALTAGNFELKTETDLHTELILKQEDDDAEMDPDDDFFETITLDQHLQEDSDTCSDGEADPLELPPIDLDDEEDSEEEEKGEIVVEKSSKHRDGTRKYDKKTYCVFCQADKTNFTRHIYRRHPDKREVMEILKRPSGDQRNVLIMQLRRQGEYLHNYKSLQNGTGTIKLARRLPGKDRLRPSTEQAKLWYAFCPHCKGTFSKANLMMHMRKCKAKKVEIAPRKARVESRLLRPVPSGTSQEVRLKILGRLQNDYVSIVVSQEPLIVEFGQYLYDSAAGDRLGAVRCKMRQVARLLMAARRLTAKEDRPVVNLEQLLDESRWEDLVRAVRELAGYEEGEGTCSKHQLALNMGTNLAKIVSCVQKRAFLEGDHAKSDKLNRFKELLDAQYKLRIKVTLPTYQPRDNNLELPSEETLRKLHNRLREELVTATQKLKDAPPDSACYLRLATLLQAKCLVLSGRRVGEVETVKLETFVERDESTLSPEDSFLTDTEKKLATKLQRIEFRGKHNAKVNMFFTPEMAESFNVLIESRVFAGVFEDNEYLFARPDSLGSLKPGQSLREACAESEMSLPSPFNTRKLRGHVAKTCQTFELEEQEAVSSERDFSMAAPLADNRMSLDMEVVANNETTSQNNNETDDQMATLDHVSLEDVFPELLQGGSVNLTLDVSSLDNLLEKSPEAATKVYQRAYMGELLPSLWDVVSSQSLAAPLPEAANKDSSQSSVDPPEDNNYLKDGTISIALDVTSLQNLNVVVPPYVKGARGPWSEAEKAAAREACAGAIQKEKQPVKSECEKALATYPVLASRCKGNWKLLKHWVKSDIEKNKKNKK